MVWTRLVPLPKVLPPLQAPHLFLLLIVFLMLKNAPVAMPLHIALMRLTIDEAERYIPISVSSV